MTATTYRNCPHIDTRLVYTATDSDGYDIAAYRCDDCGCKLFESI